MMRYDSFYAGGRFLKAGGGDIGVVVNPASEEPCANVVSCSREDVDSALLAARRGYLAWRESSLQDRRDALGRLRDNLAARGPAIVSGLAREMGCPVWLGGLMQMPMPLKGLDSAIEGLSQIAWREQVGNDVVERVASGVVLGITPWNFPVHQIVAKAAAAIAAGCSIVLKPSELAPGAAWEFIKAVDESGLPEGVVNLVWGGADVGQYLAAHPEVDRISFTGSTAVGQRIMADAATRLTPVTLELGGKSAAVLLDDADLDAAIPGVVRMGLANSGQACVSQSRLIVPEHRRQEVVERWCAAAQAWHIGDPQAAETRLGPLANARQFEHVQGLIAQARADGAIEAVAGDWHGNAGYYVAPRIFVGVHSGMAIARREVFGPVIAVLTYSTAEQALELANASEYGLSGAVWSRDAERATRFARQMRTGQVVINGAAQNLATAFGGRGMSGFGRENGRYGIEDMLTFRSLHGAAMAAQEG